MSKKKKGGWKKPQSPEDDDSFAAYIRALNKKIEKAQRHLSELSHTHDYRTRRQLERWIDQRGQALQEEPPTTISAELVEQLKEEIRGQ